MSDKEIRCPHLGSGVAAAAADDRKRERLQQRQQQQQHQERLHTVTKGDQGYVHHVMMRRRRRRVIDMRDVHTRQSILAVTLERENACIFPFDASSSHLNFSCLHYHSILVFEQTTATASLSLSTFPLL